MKKTDNAAEVGLHIFERAGLGKAPFRFVGMSVNVIQYPDGSSKAGGSCDYCGTGIANECRVKSADGKLFKVGCDCILKAGDAGLLQAYKTSPDVRRHAAELRWAKDQKKTAELARIISENETLLKSLPHPRGFTDRATGQPLSALDQYVWLQKNCGASGRASTLAGLKRFLAEAKAAEHAAAV